MTEVMTFPQSYTTHPYQLLFQKVIQLEHRLEEETQKRENDYNELLRLLISKKEQPKDQVEATARKRQHSKGGRIQTLPSSRKQALKVALHRRASQKHNEKTHESKINSMKLDVQLSVPKMLTPQVTPQQDPFPALNSKITALENGLNKQQEETLKVKELNDYLMEKMLGVFEKIKKWEESEIRVKPIVTEETVTSVVLDQNFKPRKDCSSSRLSQSGISKTDIGEVAARVAEHQSVLSQLIELTRNLSTQIKNFPQWTIPHHP